MSVNTVIVKDKERLLTGVWVASGDAILRSLALLRMTDRLCMVVRGTHLLIYVLGDGTTEVNVIDGEIGAKSCRPAAAVPLGANQAMTVDRLLSQGFAEDFAICGVGLLAQDERIGDVLSQQDHLYTLMLKQPDGGREAQVIGSIVDFLLAPRDPEAVIERMSRSETRIVSLTVTEGGLSSTAFSYDIAANLQLSRLPGGSSCSATRRVTGHRAS